MTAHFGTWPGLHHARVQIRVLDGEQRVAPLDVRAERALISATVPETPGSTAEEFALTTLPLAETATVSVPVVAVLVMYVVLAELGPTALNTRKPATASTSTAAAISPQLRPLDRRALGLRPAAGLAAATRHRRRLVRRRRCRNRSR